MRKPAIAAIIISVLYVLWQTPANAQVQYTEELDALATNAQMQPVEELNALSAAYTQLYNQAKYTEAIPIAKKILSLAEKTYGRDHEDAATAVNNLAVLYSLTGRYPEAEPLYKRSLAIRERTLGEDHPDVAGYLNNLASLYQYTGRYAEAEPLFKRSLAIREKTLGKDHPVVATALNNLAEFYRVTGRYTEAEPLYKRSLEIWERTLGEEHPNVAGSLNNLAALYDATGRYAEAEPLYKKSLAIRERTLGNNHPDVAKSLSNLAAIYQRTGRYAEAEPLYNRCLAIIETTFGKDHPDVAISLNNLAGLYDATGRYDKAESLFKRSLAIRETTLGKDHPAVAESLNNLAALYLTTGRYAEAELPNKRALAIMETTFGEDHPAVAGSLNRLAALYDATGRYAEAEPLYKRSLAIMETAFSTDHPDVAGFLNSLAALYDATGRYAEAEPLYKRSLAIRETTLGTDHPAVAESLSNLAVLYCLTDRYAEAEPLYKRVLAIRETTFGTDHPAVATSLNNLAVVYDDTGRYAEAEPLYKRSLAIRETTLGRDHPGVAQSLNNLAALCVTFGNYDLSEKNFFRGISIQEKNRENVFLLLDERQKLAFIKENSGSIASFLTLTFKHLQKDDNAAQDTLNAWLRWKGAVTEFQGRITEACFRAEDPAVKRKCDEMDVVRRTHASFLRAKPDNMDFDSYHKALAEYEGKKSALEAELSRLSKDFALEKLVGKADIPTISSILPKESVYLDFAVITPYDFKQKRFEEKTRCFVFVLIPENPPRISLVDLGYSEPIEQHIRGYHKIIQDAVSRKRPPDIDGLRKHLKALYGLVLEPLMPHIKGRKQFFISPDGSLNLIPFEAFTTPDGKYLVEEHSIQYIAAGRDIVRFQDEARAQGKTLILADPDYDLEEQKLIEKAKELGLSPQKESGVLSQEDRAMSFKSLEGASNQAEEIKKLIGGVIYPGKKAIQEVLLAAEYPKVLHIATHGYYLPVQKNAPQRGPGKDALPPEALKVYENPMLRSGIALAGANTSLRGRVIAEKVIGLKLKGTEMVVLSACQTGVGDVQTGEGVFGLKRAFILSGARTVVMSLWSVPSKETTQLMGSFYTKWAGGKSKAEALREAKLELMKENPNPFFWGAFVMVGDPGK